MGSGQTQWQEMRRHGLDLLVDAAQVPHSGPNKLRASLRAIQVTALCLGDRSSWSGKINRRSSTPYCRAAPTSGAAPFRPACKADSASRRSLAPLAYRHRLPAHPTRTQGPAAAVVARCITARSRSAARPEHISPASSRTHAHVRAPLGRAGWCGLASWRAQRVGAGAASSSTCTSCRLGPTSRCHSPRRCADQQPPPPCTRMSPPASVPALDRGGGSCTPSGRWPPPAAWTGASLSRWRRRSCGCHLRTLRCALAHASEHKRAHCALRVCKRELGEKDSESESQTDGGRRDGRREGGEREEREREK